MRQLNVTMSGKICNAIPDKIEVRSIKYVFKNSEGENSERRELSLAPFELKSHEILEIPFFPSIHVIKVKVGISESALLGRISEHIQLLLKVLTK